VRPRATYLPQVGERVVIVQSFRRRDVELCPDPDSADEQITREIPAVVHYVRRRGDYQVEFESGGRYWVDKSGHIRDAYRAAGTLRVSGTVT